LPSLRPSEVTHRQPAAINQRWHAARVEEASALAEIFGTPELHINSFHHQGIDRLAPGLEATVWAEDGLIEGVEAREYPWVYGVQWHPERGEAEAAAAGESRDPDRRLFWAFVQAARG
ncbi:MAG TPA: gamma-glutamyl-gamma-aminobutyrate hydrolase family protein, partial [Longimicrobiaceae bacterium]|nr:gamma-glutamyl-gamma-aminobutyrate hydrolase family protein [Longimicrobiaceae bacterium]